MSIKPQSGFQEKFLSTPADIAIGGGCAGSGKTFAELMESLRHIRNPDYGGVIFRKTYPQIRNPGGLWDTSYKLYPIPGGKPNESSYEWRFPTGAKIKFSHLEYEKNVFDWQGAQVPFIGFDELPHFSEFAFFYLLSRNRSTCGIRPYVRATCNPDPDSWVAEFIAWWIDQETGYPIKERAGVIRYFMKDADSYVWGDTKKEVIDKVSHIIAPMVETNPDINPADLVKSVTFIPGSIYENRFLLQSNPEYLGNLLAQDEQTRKQLLEGNWKIRVDGLDLINLVKLRDCFTNSFASGGRKYITADIALKGSDLLVIGVWDGFRLIDIEVMEISRGNEVIDLIKSLALKYAIPQSRIVYDDDGVGAFVDGFITGARGFKNGAPALHRENYTNRKTQMFFKMADRINQDGYYISPEVAKKIVGGIPVEKHILDERRCIKRDKPDSDGKLAVIPKDQMKNIIGHSPDFMDMWMMREFCEYLTLDQISDSGISKSGMGFH